MKKKVLTINLIFLMLSNLHGQVNLDSGLIAFYPFNGNANDLSKNKLHGLVYGANLSDGKYGIEDGSYYFNGADSTFILVPYSSEFNLEDTLSISLWFKYDTSSINNRATLLNKGNWGLRRSSFNEFIFYWVGPQIYLGDTSDVVWNDHYFSSYNVLNNNQWHSISIIRHKQGGMACIDGECKNSWSSAIHYPISTSDSSLVIGNVLGLNERGWNGYIDEVRIYNRLLSTQEIRILSDVVGIKEHIVLLPIKCILSQNYPNPFNPTTTIEFDLPRTSEVSLKIFNILGEEVATLVSDRLNAGSYSYEWSRPAGMASGVYLYRLSVGSLTGEAEGFIETRKMILMR